jgi:hypothetical protein
MGIGEATVTAVLGVSLGGLGVVLGQTDAPISTPNWLNALGGLTSLGFAVWYAWYVTTKTIPERDKVHAATISEIVTEFREESKEQRQAQVATVERLSVSIERAVSK